LPPPFRQILERVSKALAAAMPSWQMMHALLVTVSFAAADNAAFLATRTEKHASSMVQGFPLPTYLEEVTPDDPEYQELNNSANRYALGKPGKGSLLDFAVVRLKEDMPMRRIYGGSSKKDGYWWTLSYAAGMFWAAGEDKISMCEMMQASGVCPEWNAATHLVTCMAKKGWAFVVGQGQSAKCQWGSPACMVRNGSVLYPPAALLQVNGAVHENSVACKVCELDQTDIINSSCYL